MFACLLALVCFGRGRCGAAVVREDVHALQGKITAARGPQGRYNLRPRPDRNHDGLEVDHTFECQALAHAIVQTPSFQWGAFFSQVQLLPQGHQGDNKKQQPEMVMSRLAAVVELHKYVSVSVRCVHVYAWDLMALAITVFCLPVPFFTSFFVFVFCVFTARPLLWNVPRVGGLPRPVASKTPHFLI